MAMNQIALALWRLDYDCMISHDVRISGKKISQQFYRGWEGG